MGVSAPLTSKTWEIRWLQRKELSSYVFPSDKWTKWRLFEFKDYHENITHVHQTNFIVNCNGIVFIYRSHTNNHRYATGADYRVSLSIDLSLLLSRENTINNSSYKSTRGSTNVGIVCDNVLISKSDTILNKLKTWYDTAF